MLPSLSIVTPVHNGARHLAATVESILNQSLADFEYILIDDGSTDASPEILAAYAAKDTRIRVITQSNQGIAHSRNRGFIEARADVVAFLDHDDIALPERMARQLTLLSERSDITAVGCFMEFMAEDEKSLYVGRHPHVPEAVRAHILAGECPIPTTCLMVRRDIALRYGGLNPAYEPADDFEFLLRLIQNGHACALVPEVWQRYRVMRDNTSHKRAVAMLRCSLAALYNARSSRLRSVSALDGAPSSHASTINALHNAAEGAEAAFWTDYLLRSVTLRNASPFAREEETILALSMIRRYGCTARRKCASRIWRHLSLPWRERARAALSVALGPKSNP